MKGILGLKAALTVDSCRLSTSDTGRRPLIGARARDATRLASRLACINRTSSWDTALKPESRDEN
jgi:hypothetical protein